MSAFLRDDMRLRAVNDRPGGASLDVVTGMVYECAKQNKTIGETAASCGLDGDLTRRIVTQLIEMKLVATTDTGSTSSRSAPPSVSPERRATSRLEEQHKFNAFEDTETFVEKLETLFVACKTANYYDLLDVDPDTPRVELRNRYFELSKRFHPDKAFQQEARERKDKMAFIFQKLTAAYDTLSNSRKREAYNATIEDQLELRTIERKLEKAVKASKTSESEAPEGPTTESAAERGAVVAAAQSPSKRSPISGPTSAPSPSAGVGAYATQPPEPGGESAATPSESPPRQRRFESSKPPNAPRFRPSSPSIPEAEVRRREIKRRLAGRAMADLLSRRSMPPPNVHSIDKLLKEATLAVEQDRFADAINLAKAILKQLPNHKEATELLGRAGEGLSRVQATLHIRRGRYAVKDGQVEQAKWHYEQALVVDKKNIEARHLLAELVLTADKNIERALSLMKEVIVLGGQRARYFATLGEIFLAAEDFARASDAFNRALTMEPDNRELKKKLKLCSR